MVFELNGKSFSFWWDLSILCHIPLNVYVSIVHNYAREGNNIRRWQAINVRLITSFNISGTRKKSARAIDEKREKNNLILPSLLVGARAQ